jgi:3',5'-cyclic AMP phosphodiesterase CpdA
MRIHRRRTLSVVLALTWLAATGAAAPLRVVVLGDTRTNHDVHQAIWARVMAEKAAFIIHTGDLVDTGSSEEGWKRYDSITQGRDKVPFYPARGNHDVGGPGFGTRFQKRFSSRGVFYGSFTKGKLHGVILDTCEPIVPDSPQFKWLEADLKRAQRDKKTVLVAMHVPLWSPGGHGDNPELQKALHPLFLTYGVKAVVAGHDHLYARSSHDGIVYLVAGGGGAPLYPVLKAPADGEIFSAEYHYVICELTKRTLTARAVRRDGTEIDRFDIPL